VAHLLAYALDSDFNWSFVAGEMLLRLYLTIGFVALAGMAILGITSTDGWIRRLGRGWNYLHRLIYPLAVLVLVHILLVRLDVATGGYLLWLLAYRVMRRVGIPTSAPALLGLAFCVFLLAVAGEFLWYATMTGLDPWRTLAADFDATYGVHRPVWKVLAAGLAAATLSAARLLRPPAAITPPFAARQGL
jgi:sulfoxide reductase heme-binding subunit YedZ